MILSRHQNVMPVLGILRLRDSAAGPGDVCIVTPWAGGGTLKQYLLAHAADADRVSIVRCYHLFRDARVAKTVT